MVLLAAVAITPVATFLQVKAPLDSRVTVDALGQGSSCTLNILDNENDTASGRLGRISTIAQDGVADKYIIDFGGLAISRYQDMVLGSLCDPLFSFCALQNNYDKPMRVKLELASNQVASLPVGMTIEFIVSIAGDAKYVALIWKDGGGNVHLLSLPSSFILPVTPNNIPMHMLAVWLHVRTDGSFSYTGPVSVQLRLVAQSEPPY